MEWIEGEPPAGAHWVEDCVAQLRGRPGIWADVRTYYNASSATAAVQRLQSKKCDARSRFIDGEHHIFARWPG